MLVRTVIGAAALALSAAVVPSAYASAPRLTTTTLYYDDSGAAEFKSAVQAGAASWNANLRGIQLAEAAPGRHADITVTAYDGWPEATLGPVRPGGHGDVHYGREAVNEGYDTIRVAAHELGHSLGLPDNKPGPCSSLMSGSTGGVTCTNATPNAEEIAAVEANYANAAAARPLSDRTPVGTP